MPRRRRSSGLPLVGVAAVAIACLVCAPLGLSRWSSAPASLGPPSSLVPAWQAPFLTAYLALRQGSLTAPAGDPSMQTSIEVEPGESAGEVVDRLAEAGVVSDPLLLKTYLRYRGLDVGIEAGRYAVDGGQTLEEIAAALQSAADSRYTLVVPEGWRREQIAQAIGSLDLEFSPADFLTATRRKPPWDVGGRVESLEGFLFPDSYRLDPRWSSERVVQLMLDTFQRRVDGELREGFSKQGLSLLEAVTLASIVEREAILPEERPLIASVFLNRLAQRMKLQADPTVQYALGFQPDGGWWKSPLAIDDLAVTSPYNTYLVGGLPPGPIANPGLDSLQAVADPAVTTYYYFRAACDGSGAHLFAATFEEHSRNACP